jgi:thioredoxin-related protein
MENCKFARNFIVHKPKYLYKSEEFLKVYEFVSEGPKGSIKKMVQFTETGTNNVYIYSAILNLTY